MMKPETHSNYENHHCAQPTSYKAVVGPLPFLFPLHHTSEYGSERFETFY